MNYTSNIATLSRPIVEARGIVKVLATGDSQHTILKEVDLELKSGELTLLMGPSGSGKTTLLSILGCILSPTRGSLSIAGVRASGLAPEALAALRRKYIGFVFQSYNLFPTLTALENVMIALDVRSGTQRGAARQAAEALEAVGLSHRINAYPSKLSGGEKQRVAIARALAGSSSVILADEPTAALDSTNGQGVMELLANVARNSHRAVLAVTHDLRTVSYADRILRIEDGSITGDERCRKPHTDTNIACKSVPPSRRRRKTNV